VLYRTQKSTKIIKLKVPVVNTLFLSKNQTQLNTTMRNHQYHHSSKKASGVTIFLYLNITLSVWKSEGWNIAWSDKKKVFQYIPPEHTHNHMHGVSNAWCSIRNIFCSHATHLNDSFPTRVFYLETKRSSETHLLQQKLNHHVPGRNSLFLPYLFLFLLALFFSFFLLFFGQRYFAQHINIKHQPHQNPTLHHTESKK